MRGLSQGAISQQIQKLEAQLGVRLIERDSAGCSLTYEGRVFLPYAERLLTLSTNALGAFRDKPITIGASSNIGIYLLSPYVKAYLKGANEKSQLDVKIYQNPTVADKLATGEVDVAAMEWWDGRPGYEARLWRHEELVVIVPPNHPWASLKCLPRDMLKGVPLLGGEPGTGTGRILANYYGVDAPEITVGMQLGSTDAVKHWVKAGLGVSLVLASSVIEEIRVGMLVSIPLEDGGPQKALYIIWRDTLAENHPAHRFGSWLVSCADGSGADIHQ